MITPAKVNKLLKPGDFVFIVDNNTVQAKKIKAIFADSLKVENGFLYFDNHGYDWWLTQKVALEQTRGIKYV